MSAVNLKRTSSAGLRDMSTLGWVRYFSSLYTRYTRTINQTHRASVNIVLWSGGSRPGTGGGLGPLTFCLGPQFFHRLLIIAPRRLRPPPSVLARTATGIMSHCQLLVCFMYCPQAMVMMICDVYNSCFQYISYNYVLYIWWYLVSEWCSYVQTNIIVILSANQRKHCSRLLK